LRCGIFLMKINCFIYENITLSKSKDNLIPAYCPYCNSLHKAIENQNFCSQQGDSIKSVSTNAYYFKSNDLHSGEHVSRFSVRTISDGYQHHIVNKKNYVLDSNNYLIINEGEPFYSEIKTNNPVEGLLVAFNKADCLFLKGFMEKTEEQFVDDPFEHEQTDFVLETQKLEINPRVRILLDSLKKGITNDIQQKLYYEEIFQQLLVQIIADQTEIEKRLENLTAKKKQTQKEIYRRITTAKEYLEANLDDSVNLDTLSKVAALSPFHLLRSFKKVYALTPHQYLTQKRVEKSRFLLKDSHQSISEIAENVGFQSQSAFGRLFKQVEGQSPQVYREFHR